MYNKAESEQVYTVDFFWLWITEYAVYLFVYISLKAQDTYLFDATTILATMDNIRLRQTNSTKLLN